MAGKQFSRQMATIMSVDAVGYSLRMRMNEDEALDAFRERAAMIVAACEGNGGRMFGNAGDSLMAEFGSPVEAVRTALAFQKSIRELNSRVESEVRRMAFRVGINTGDVIVDEGLLFGHDVNIAARLQEKAPEGGVVVSASTLSHAQGKLAAAFVDLGQQSLKNIREPVSAYEALAEGENPSRHAQPAQQPARSGPAAAAVLPFRNHTGEKDLDYLGHALAEDVIFGLSNMRWLPVISRSSSIQFDHDDVSPADAARQLGARYVASGRISAQQGRLRVDVALEDAETGRVMLTKRFDATREAIREAQDGIGSDLVSALGSEVDRAEQVRAFKLPHENMGTWELVARGRYHMSRRTSEDTDLAMECFTRAFKRDPASSAVLNELAWWHFWQGFTTMQPEHFEKVIDYSNKALFMDSQDARPHAFLGATEIMLQRPAEARPWLENALRINPSFAFAYSALASTLSLLGDPAGAIPLFRQAEKLSPFDLYQFHNLGELAAAQTCLGQWNEVIATANRALSLSPSYWYARFLKIGALAQLGLRGEAREERAILLERLPQFLPVQAEWIPFVDKTIIPGMVSRYEMTG